MSDLYTTAGLSSKPDVFCLMEREQSEKVVVKRRGTGRRDFARKTRIVQCVVQTDGRRLQGAVVGIV
jgi:hypothetical protein